MRLTEVKGNVVQDSNAELTHWEMAIVGSILVTLCGDEAGGPMIRQAP
jgi:hypothetical protein